jgi:hypothetical protein
MATDSGLFLGATGFSDTTRVAIRRDIIKMLRAEAIYAQPESVLALSPDSEGGNTFVRKATAWTDVPAANSGKGSTLSEGIPPTARKMAEDSISATVIEVGDYMPVYSQAAYQYGEKAAIRQVLDKVNRMQFLAWDSWAQSLYAAGTADVFGGTASSQATLVPGNVLTTPLVDELVTRARENDLEPFSDGLYRIIGGPRAFKSLIGEALASGGGFVNAANFGTVGDLRKADIGAYHGAVFTDAGSRALKTADVVGPVIPGAGNAIIAATNLFTSTSPHGLVTGQRVKLVSVTGGAGLTAGTIYFVRVASTTTFAFTATSGGADIDVTSDSSAQVVSSVTDVYRCVLVGKQSIALSDLGSVHPTYYPGGGPTDPLGQITAVIGFRGFMGGTLVSLANFSDGSGSLSADIKRSISFEVTNS